MDQQLKQRLIGVTIIVALVVIFVPMLFDSSDKRTQLAGDNIPPIPDNILEKPIELPKTAEDLAPKDEQKPPETGYRVIPLTDEAPVKKAAEESAAGKNTRPIEARDNEEEMAPAEEDLPAEKSQAVSSEAPKPKAMGKPVKGEAATAAAKQEAKPEPRKTRSAPTESEVSQNAEPASKAGSSPQRSKTAAQAGKPPIPAPKPAEAPLKKAETPKAVEASRPAAQRSESPSTQAPSKSSVPPAAKVSASPVPELAKAPPPPKAAEPTQNPRAAVKSGAEKGDISSSWVIQVGSFTNEDKARALADKLRQSKFAAFVEAVHGENGSLYRVQVGPELDRGRAEQMQKQMESGAGVKGIIIPHR